MSNNPLRMLNESAQQDRITASDTRCLNQFAAKVLREAADLATYDGNVRQEYILTMAAEWENKK